VPDRAGPPANPWPGVAAARAALGALAHALRQQQDAPGASPAAAGVAGRVDAGALAGWLLEQGIGPLAHHAWGPDWPELARLLAPDAYAAAAEGSVRRLELDRILAALQCERIPVVLLKGAALAEEVYREPALRTMSDVDLWLPADRMARAAALMGELGYLAYEKSDRPVALQQLSRGEIQFYSADRPPRLVELHWSPFPGWWLRRTAAVDDAAVWDRCEPLLVGGRGWARRLAPEDMVIQLATHLALGAQFKPPSVRALFDIALAAGRYLVDWEVVAVQARRWRVATPVWAALQLADALIGVRGAERALARLRPGAFRRMLLRALVSPASVLAGRDVTAGRRRYLLLGLLVDRPGGMLHLAWRAVWPERQWLAARYGTPSRREHLASLVRHGRI
jgi:hypothetical protein